MYKIQLKSQAGEPHWIAEKNIALGSAEDCTIIVPSAEAHHARIISQNNHAILRDNRSQSGTFINGQRITEKEIFPGDVIRIGKEELVILGPGDSLKMNAVSQDHLANRWCLVSNSSWLAGQEFVITLGISAIGRGAQCEIVIPGTHLSRQHAEFELHEGQLRIRDLGSANGTFVNENRIEANQPIRLVPGDRLRFDVYSFQVVGPGMTTGSTRLRQPLSETQPINRKAVSSDPKAWKTKPTSPGNREEPVHNTKGPIAAAVVFLIITVAAGLYLAFQM
ncbi:FHA domain-containing protein [Simiduia curdlanivorans]|uniref:FHA domain-containing protein n=1 Tax=Simiduia curdlanivorans TaxID=1492769 RepID=A0ABV8V601_9GAMM|nr:FHA domain-containing protein [Simiduia curdlanivorans]MDN3640837.1 FHA domain-containing protein [Simiduia curdlanivorans]